MELLPGIAEKMVSVETQYSKVSLANMSIQLESTSEKLESIQAMLANSVDLSMNMNLTESKSSIHFPCNLDSSHCNWSLFLIRSKSLVNKPTAYKGLLIRLQRSNKDLLENSSDCWENSLVKLLLGTKLDSSDSMESTPVRHLET